MELIGQLERIHNSVSKIEQRHINEQLLLQRENLQIKDELNLLDEVSTFYIMKKTALQGH